MFRSRRRRTQGVLLSTRLKPTVFYRPRSQVFPDTTKPLQREGVRLPSLRFQQATFQRIPMIQKKSCRSTMLVSSIREQNMPTLTACGRWEWLAKSVPGNDCRWKRLSEGLDMWPDEWDIFHIIRDLHWQQNGSYFWSFSEWKSSWFCCYVRIFEFQR